MKSSKSFWQKKRAEMVDSDISVYRNNLGGVDYPVTMFIKHDRMDGKAPVRISVWMTDTETQLLIDSLQSILDRR